MRERNITKTNKTCWATGANQSRWVYCIAYTTRPRLYGEGYVAPKSEQLGGTQDTIRSLREHDNEWCGHGAEWTLV